MDLSDFQQRAESGLIDALAERGIRWSRELTSTSHNNREGTPEPVIEANIGDVHLEILTNQAFIGGRKADGSEIDRRYEAWAYEDQAPMIRAFIRQVVHYVEGNSDDV